MLKPVFFRLAVVQQNLAQNCRLVYLQHFETPSVLPLLRELIHCEVS